jgi:hypothetical protein
MVVRVAYSLLVEIDPVLGRSWSLVFAPFRFILLFGVPVLRRGTGSS